MNPAEIQSWPIPGLTFVRVDGILRSFDLDQEEQQRRQSPRPNDPVKPPKRMYLMEDALTGLSSQKAYVAFLLLGNKTGANFYIGMSLQTSPEGLEETELAEICYEIQKSILHSVYQGVDINKTIFTGTDLSSMIAPLATNVGIVTGIASLKSSGDYSIESEQIERIASGLQGQDFGMLILAAPVPSKLLSEEELIMFDQVTENEDAKKKRRLKYYLELQDAHAYLKHIQLGLAIGLWQVGVYFFAPRADVFARMQSLIKATYADEGARPAPLQTHVFAGLQEHLLSFGLLRNHRPDLTAHKLLTYEFLTPLNSRMLSAYIHLPKRDMPGFKVRRV